MDSDLSRAEWRNSSYSNGGGNCVEIRTTESGAVTVRDSKDPDGPRLVFNRDEWQSFVAGVRVGKFDLS